MEAPGGPGARAVVLAAALVVNPLAAVLSPAVLGLDWLRTDGLYRRFVAGPYYPFRYPAAWASAAGFLGQGLLAGLLGPSRGRSRV